MSSLKELKSYYQQHRKQIESDYFTFLKFPSISSESENTTHMIACVNWIKDYLLSLGFETEIWETEGHPVLYASHMKAGKDKPIVLIYNHYDVQPVDPLDQWKSPPFEPTIKDGEVYARGAQDNKGQCMYTLAAITALLEMKKELPVNLKLCIEGEEEMGSVNLIKLAQGKQNELKADHLLIVDFGIPDINTPAVSLGIRGILTCTIEMIGSTTDLHSGEHGGAVYNPNRALVELLAKLYDINGKVTVPGFYDDIQMLSDKEKSEIDFSFDEKHYHTLFGAKATGGEKEFSPLERCWLRPTLEINGIAGGYSGTGFKTVIPAKAIAKISCRLVPNQDPDKVFKELEAFLKTHTPKGISLKITRHGGGKATRTSPHSKGVRATAKAYEEIFEKSCKNIMAGGTISVVPILQKASGADTVMLGLGLQDDQIHAPNEHFGLDRLEKGYLLIARTLEHLSKPS